MKFSLRISLVAILSLALTTWAAAQGSATGDLRVTVKDPNGSLVTNATVTASDQTKAFERSTNNNLEGEYVLLSLPPSVYTIIVQAPGFARVEAKNQLVTVGQRRELALSLTLAAVTETVDVTSEAAVVETQRSASTNTIEQRRIDNLPTNGRNYINFALTDSRLARDTAPSIGAAPTSGLNIAGQRARANLVNVDGVDFVDNSTNGIRSTVSQEAVQEFQIQTNSYAAEYGRASAGVINIITRSGSNDFHGSVFGYLRNRNFQAVNPFSTISNPAYTRTQFGTAFGGAIKKDKTFYFFSYEGTRRQETGFSSIGAGNFGLLPFDTSQVGLPLGSLQLTPDQIGFLTNPAVLFAEGTVPGFAQEVGQYAGLAGASSGQAVNGFWPTSLTGIPGFSSFPTTCAPPGPCFVPQSYVSLNSLRGNFPVSERTDLYSLRLDHNLTLNNHLMLAGRVSPSDVTGIQVQAQGPQNFGQNAFSRTSNQDYHDLSVSAQDQWTISNNKINEFRFQYARRGLNYGYSRDAGGSNVAVNIPGVAFFGREPFSYVQRTEQRYQLVDNFSWSKGSHTFKFGVDGNYIPLQANFTVNFGGIYNFGTQSIFPGVAPPGVPQFPAFSAVQAYGAGIPSNFIQGVGNPHDAFSNSILGVFAQDSWRVKSNLTINYGVRYDVEFTPQFNALTPLAKYGQDFLGTTKGIPRDYNNISPRVGVAWDPWKNGKSVFRASYGIFYGHPLLGLAFISDVTDGTKAPQIVLFPGPPGGCTPTLSNLNASNAFQGLLSCLPAAFTYQPNQQRFDPTANAQSLFVNQGYLAAGVPLAIQPFGFPNTKSFVTDYTNQANLTFERDLGHDYSLGIEWNFAGGRHINRPINVNAVRTDLLVANWQAAVSDPTSNAQLGPLAVGTGAAPCGFNPSGVPWVSAALTSFFRPSGLNPSIANAFIAGGAGACVGLANQLLQAAGLHSTCDPTTLTNCVPFSDAAANASTGSSVYHALTVNLKKRFGRHYELLTSYTWSHAIDDSTDLQAPLSPQNNYNANAERSNSAFDQRHRLVFSMVYQTGHIGGSAWMNRLFGDVTVSPVIEYVSGRPFNIIVGDDRNFDFSSNTDRPLTASAGATNSCGDTAAPSRYSPTGFFIPACFLNGTTIGNLGRNAGTKPYNIFTDLRVSKLIRLGERFSIEGSADAFNLINKFNVADVNPLWNTGQPASAAFDPRQFQFSLRVKW